MFSFIQRSWRGLGVITLVLTTVVMLLACTGKGDCGRDDGCFGDGDFDGKPNKAPASSPAK